MKSLDDIARALSDDYNLPYYSNTLPQTLKPFIRVTTSNKGLEEVIDRFSFSGGILILRATGKTKIIAQALQACTWYCRLFTTLSNTINTEKGTVCKSIPSPNIMILFFGNGFQKEKLFSLGVLPLEIVESPKIYGLI